MPATNGSTAEELESGGGGSGETQQQQHRQPLQQEEEFKDKDPERLIKMVRRE